MNAIPFWTHWYEVVETTELRQGDIFRGLSVAWFPQQLDLSDVERGADEPATEDVFVSGGDWILLTGSCDLDQRRCQHVLLAQVLPATQEGFRASGEKEFEKMAEVVRRGLDPAKFMLAEYPEIEPPFARSVVYFRNHFLMPIEYVERACTGPRLRLRHPFREQLGIWVGACFSRVGPEDECNIPPSGVKVFPAHILKAVEE